MGKVYLKLNESDITCVKSGLLFYFSSELYRNKFEKNVEEFIENEKLKIQVRYKINNDFTIYFLLSYYKKCEKRGFRIYDMVNKKPVVGDEVIVSFITS